jgi:hypothetical protein
MFSIQPELLINLKGVRREGNVEIVRTDSSGAASVAYETQKQDLTYLELPLYFVLKVPIGPGYFNVAAGPYVAYGVASQVQSHFTQGGLNIDPQMEYSSLRAPLFTNGGSTSKSLYRPWDFGLSAMIGWEFGFGLFVDAGYSHSVATVAADRNYNDRNSVIALSAGFKF